MSLGHAYSHSSQPDLFDSVAAARLRDAGMTLAAENKNPLLLYAREGAREIARGRESREVTADDVQAWLVGKGFKESALENAAGSVFREKCWRFVRWTTSKRPAAHARGIRVWRLVEGFFTTETQRHGEDQGNKR
jgi:hypothetical protein